MKLIYQGAMWAGGTTLQRFEAFKAHSGITAVSVSSAATIGERASLYQRIRWRLRWPVDSNGENESLLQAAAAWRPDSVLIDNSRVIRSSTLKGLRDLGVRSLAYYTPDDIIGAHNLSWPLKLSLTEWDVFFTTKTFNVTELRERGVRNPVLMGKAFDPQLHRPLSAAEVGEEFERFDLVFIGTFEAERCASINLLAEHGLSVVVYGGTLGNWRSHNLHPSIKLRPAVFGHEYCRSMHHGKIALCFLRKLNRDRITQRTMEIAAMGRAMLAEKTDEHDAHFVDGHEYIGFADNIDLTQKAKAMLLDIDKRKSIGVAARRRCLSADYSVARQVDKMVEVLKQTIRT